MPYKYKKIILSMMAVVIILGGVKSYFYLISANKLTGVVLTNPVVDSDVNGIIRLSAKTEGQANLVRFVIKKENENKIKTSDAYFEPDVKEWAYYWNTLGLKNGHYLIESYAFDKKRSYQASANITIQNDVEDDSIEFVDIANEKNAPEKLPKIQERTEDTKNINSPNAVSKDDDEQKLVNDKISVPAETVNKENILSGIFKALDQIYYVLNDTTLDISASNEGKVAGESITKPTDNNGASELQNPELKTINVAEASVDLQHSEESPEQATYCVPPLASLAEVATEVEAVAQESQNSDNGQRRQTDTALSQDTESNNWFKYNLKITSHENKDAISKKTTLTASCNNPLDSVEFIMDSLETDELDYSFKAVNNYGYYTYWTYQIEPENIKKGEYLLYAKGFIDWYTYESPIIIVAVE